MTVITLYTTPGCHLCDEVRTELLALLEGREGIELRELNIEEDDRMLAAYLERIPVVELRGEVVSELELDAEKVDAALHKIGTVRP